MVSAGVAISAWVSVQVSRASGYAREVSRPGAKGQLNSRKGNKCCTTICNLRTL